MGLFFVVLAVVPLISGQAVKNGTSVANVPDAAYLQKIWDGWGMLNATHQSQFYDHAPHLFFDESPLKYSDWKSYETGSNKILATIKTAKFTVNKDAQIHSAGDYAWAAATVNQDAVLKGGKRDVTTFRWTVIFQKENEKWLIVHEHVSRTAD